MTTKVSSDMPAELFEHRIAKKPTGRRYCADCNAKYVKRYSREHPKGGVPSPHP